MADLLNIGVDYQTKDDFCECVAHLNDVRNGILRKMEEEGIHVLLAPVMPFPAMNESVTGMFSGLGFHLSTLVFSDLHLNNVDDFSLP